MNRVHKAVIANSMWRTGSTYLAKQFADVPRYKLFYEPCHEIVPAASVTEASQEAWAEYFEKMRHPEFEEQPFAVFNEIDKETGCRLNELFDPASSFRNIYNNCSEETVEYLLAAARVAEASGQVPFFGFCRSGLQHTSWDKVFEGQHFYQWRDPREQFRSYGWGRNNFYFVPATMTQLLLSQRLAPIVDSLASPWRAKPMRLILRQVPDSSSRNLLRLGRVFALQLSLDQVYALFYLSWLASYLSHSNTVERSFSLRDLVKDAALREHMEFEYGITFTGPREPPQQVVDGIDYAKAEKAVEVLVDRFLSDSAEFAAKAGKRW